MKKATFLFFVYNVFWGLVQAYKIIEYILARNITQNDLVKQSFLSFTLISIALVVPLNLVQFFSFKKQNLWSNTPYVASLGFVCLTYIVGLTILLFMSI